MTHDKNTEEQDEIVAESVLAEVKNDLSPLSPPDVEKCRDNVLLHLGYLFFNTPELRTRLPAEGPPNQGVRENKEEKN